MVLYGQVVVGPPGAGKTTYCQGIQMFTKELDRKTAIINLDFANDVLPYQADIDIRDFFTIQQAMEDYDLGPNGGLIFCMESLFQNISWLLQRIEALEVDYLVIDCPGQVELYTHHNIVQQILTTLEKELNVRLCCVMLLDSFYCSQPATFISAVLLATSTMLKIGLPHINVLSKVDLLNMYGELPFNLDFFTDMMNLSPLLRYVNKKIPTLQEIEAKEKRAKERSLRGEGDGSLSSDDEEEGDMEQQTGRTKLQQKYYQMTEAICEVVDNYGLVSFYPLNIQDASLVARVLSAVDKANGYSAAIEYAQMQRAPSTTPSVQSSAQRGHLDQNRTAKQVYEYMSSQLESSQILSLEIQEKYGKS